MRGVSLTHPMLPFFLFFLFFFLREFLLHIHPVPASFSSGSFLLNILCCLHFYVGSFSYTSHADFVLLQIPCCLHVYLGVSFTPPSLPLLAFLILFFMWGVSLTHPVLSSFYGEFLLHIPCWLHFYVGSFSYTSLAGFVFILGVSLTHPELVYLFYGGSFSDTSRAGFTFIWGVSLTHPVLALLFCSEFLLHIPYWF